MVVLFRSLHRRGATLADRGFQTFRKGRTTFARVIFGTFR